MTGSRNTTFESSELEKLFHIRDDKLHGRGVPLIHVYDPTFEGEYFPDSEHDSDWYMWHAHDDKLHPIATYGLVSGQYFAKESEQENDIFYPFVHYYTQRASWPEVIGILRHIVDDIHNLATSVSKIALIQSQKDDMGFGVQRYVTTEIEYIFTVCRSLYDDLQFIASRSWNHVEVREGHQNNLPTTFSEMVLSGDEPRSQEELIDAYGIPETLSIYYNKEAEYFLNVRKSRDEIHHHGGTPDQIFLKDEGFAVDTTRAPFDKFDAWEDDQINQNNLGPLWPFIGHIIETTLNAMNRFQKSFAAQIKLPPPIAPEYYVLMRGEHLPCILHLDSLQEEDVWGHSFINVIHHVGS